MQIKILKWGNSCALRLNKDLLQLLSAEDGSVLDVEVKDNTLILSSPGPRYTLDELLAGCQKDNFSLSDKDRQWLNGRCSPDRSKPAGNTIE